VLDALVDRLREIFPPSFLANNGDRIVINVPEDWLMLNSDAQNQLKEADLAVWANRNCVSTLVTIPDFFRMGWQFELHILVGTQLILW
jgi:hypothetical protein